MSSMFYNSKFNGDISNWKFNTKPKMSFTFYKSSLVKNIPKWYYYD